MFKFKAAGQEVRRHKIQFQKARSPRETLNDLDEYLRAQGTEPIEWLAREVRRWGEFSYEELEQAILDGRLDELIDWQSRYADLINGTLSAQWAAAMKAAAAKATHGQIVLYDSDADVQSWLKRRGGELITVLSEESKKAVANVILYGQSGLVNPRQIAYQIRPLIGLNARQAQANINYRERIYQRYISNGVNPVTAAEKADAAALKYAGKQHRFRAETITHTEMAFAYNQGADVGVKRAVKQGLMGKCEMVWTTAGTNRVCPRCLALKDTVVGHTDESGVTLPPLHPRCRCAIMYREVETPAVMKPKPPELGFASYNDIERPRPFGTPVPTPNYTNKPSPTGIVLVPRNYNSWFCESFGKEHYDATREILESSPNKNVALLWSRSEDTILNVINKEYTGKAHYDPARGGIYFDVAADVENSSSKNPYQTLFHEGGHNIDAKHGSNDISRGYYYSASYKKGAFIKAIHEDVSALVVKDIDKACEDLYKEYKQRRKIKDVQWLLDNHFVHHWELNADGSIPRGVKVSQDFIRHRCINKVFDDVPEKACRILADIFEGVTWQTKNRTGWGHGQKYWSDTTFKGIEYGLATETFAHFIESAIANEVSYQVLCEKLPKATKIFNEMIEALLNET